VTRARGVFLQTFDRLTVVSREVGSAQSFSIPNRKSPDATVFVIARAARAFALVQPGILE